MFYSVIDTWCLMVREYKGLLLGSTSVSQRRFCEKSWNKKNNNCWSTAKNFTHVSKYRRKFCPAVGSTAIVSVRLSLRPPPCFLLSTWLLMLHPFDIVNKRPWPLTGAIGAIVTSRGLIKRFHQYDHRLLGIGAIITVLTIIQWWRDVTREGTYQGLHTEIVTKGLSLFIVSEVLFFVSFVCFCS